MSSSGILLSNHIYVITFFLSGAVIWVCSVKKVFLNTLQNSQENTCIGVSFLIKLQGFPTSKETLAQMFSCRFCEIFEEHIFCGTSVNDCSVLFDFCNINFHKCVSEINFEYDNTFEEVKHLTGKYAFDKEEKTRIVKN